MRHVSAKDKTANNLYELRMAREQTLGMSMSVSQVLLKVWSYSAEAWVGPVIGGCCPSNVLVSEELWWVHASCTAAAVLDVMPGTATLAQE